MAYPNDYVKTNYVNDTTPALNQTHLNHGEQGIKTNCERIAALSTGKAEQSDLLTTIKNVSYDSATGTFTFTLWNNQTIVIDTDIEKIAVNFDYDDDPTSPHYQNLIITLEDGTKKYVDMSALLTQYEFTDSTTIRMTVSGSGTVSAEIIAGSITADKLQPNFLADCQNAKDDAEAAANSSDADRLAAEGYAYGTQNGVDVGPGSPYYHNNCKWYKEQAQQIAGSALGGLSDVTITTPSKGQVLTYDAANNIWINSSCNDVQTVNGNPLSFSTESAQAARAVTVTFNPIQASGTPTPSSPIPIYGYDKAEVKGTGKNLLDAEDYYGAYKQSEGVYSTTAPNLGVIHIPLKDHIGKTLTFSSLISAGASQTRIYVSANINGTSINGNQITAGNTGVSQVSFTVATENDYIQFNYGGTSDTNTVADIQLELGSTATTYEPYNSATDISLNLPSTIYGGILDVSSGKLTVNRGIVDMGDLTWTHTSIVVGGITLHYFTSSDISNKKDYVSSELSTLVCSIYKTVKQAEWTNNVPCIFNQSGGLKVVVADNNYTDAATFKTAVTGQKFVYELATPYEIQLTPQQIALLQGANVITSNGTTIALTYREGVIANLKDVENLTETINEVGKIADGEKSADKITAGTLGGMVKANPTAQANLGTAQVRDIYYSDTEVVYGSASSDPEGSLRITYR